MADRIELEQDFFSPYKNTRLFVKDGKSFFGIWQPLEVQIDGDERVEEVRFGEEGCLDFLAGRFLGNRALWRVIAQVNLIDRPWEQVVPGLRVIIPKSEHVNAALLAAGQRLTAEAS